MDYDDKRCCSVCKQVCIFSAVACECSNVKVVCPYHYERLCKCGKDKKFIIGMLVIMLV
ncbi:hypothetical protein EON65_36495 [archaeon]|nr:MAG: hypothetical protein EON65_36495 [archaeon]